MANDTEARATGSSAMIIGVVALVLIVGLAAVFFMRGDNADTVGDTTIVNPPSTTIVEPPASAPDGPDVTIEAPEAPAAPAMDGGTAPDGAADGGNTTN